MNKHIKALTLVLVGFSVTFSLSSQREVEKVKGSEFVWQEAQTIVSGEKYLITAESGEKIYYLQARGNAHIQYGEELNFSTTNIKSWTFTVEEKGYLITDDSGNILYCLSSGSNRLAAGPSGGSNDDNKYWTFTENNELKTSETLEYTLSFEPSNNTWTHQSHKDRVSNLKFYALVEQEDAASFAAWIMAQEGGDIITLECNTKYNTAKAQWNALSSGEQELFKSNGSYSDARERLTRWAVANGETIEYFYTSSVQDIRSEQEKSSGLVFMIIASLMLSSVFVISKRTKVKD